MSASRPSLSAKMQSVRNISPVWIIPIVTLVIGAWLSVSAWQKRGTDIHVTFDSASGIEVGKTLVRLKDVPVGKVTRVRLTKDLSKVRVKISLDKEIGEHLSEHSRFWLVTPRISATGISNLGTLISGVYIVMDPGEEGRFQRNFEGLPEPPAVRSDEKGTQYVLLAEQLGSLDVGSPIYYRNVRVGEVTSYKLSEQGTHVEIRIFVQAPYDKMVYTKTHFWNVSGFGVSIGADGVKAQMASLASLISGGVAFDNPVGFEVSTKALSNQSFNLFSDKESIDEGRYTLQYFYRLKFSHSVRGLNVGAPVEFRGVKIGEVVEIKLDKVAKGPESLHVFISIEPQRLDSSATHSREAFDAVWADLVAQGLRAQMASGSLITGSRYVALSFPLNAEEKNFAVHEQYSDIPTQDTVFDQLDQQLAKITTKIDQIPIEKMGQDLAGSLKSLQAILATVETNKTADKIDQVLGNVGQASEQLDEIMQSMHTAVGQLSDTLSSVEGVVASDGSMHHQVQQTLESVKQSADSLEVFLKQLHEKPDALIFGGAE